MLSDKTIARLSLYRRLLKEMAATAQATVFSYELAKRAAVTPAQVRRDVMAVGYSGSPAHGYRIQALVDSIGACIDPPEPQPVVLVGVGNLGRALQAFFVNRSPQFTLVAGFDTDPAKVNRVIHGCRCHGLDELERVVREESVKLAVLTVPADQAQPMAHRLYGAGVRGFVNFAPVRLSMPEDAYVENVDVTMSLERAAYFTFGGLAERNR